MGGNPSPNPPKQPPPPAGRTATPGNLSDPLLLLQVLGGQRWRWTLRTIDGRPVDAGITDTRGLGGILLTQRVMLLDVPEAGVFGLPVCWGVIVQVAPDS
ncbi:MAG: hypothetical protein DRQ55_12605 [Planctomycetota bacterium]|nr:MAG: hypothetical protein DRQ55_12605 [Planctomycetota bacterium]